MHVVSRFLLRFVILCGFAAIVGHGFARTFASLLLLAAILSGIIAVLRRERALGPLLTHWDEAIVYLAVSGLIGSLSY